MGMIQIDMPMPESCVVCRFSQGGYMYCHAMPENFCGYVNYCEENGRPEWCPLKAEEPRVMTLDEVKYSSDPVWLEWRNLYIKPALLHSDQVTTEDCRNAITFILFGSEEWFTFADDDYGKEIRCWTPRPTDEQREAIPWN